MKKFLVSAVVCLMVFAGPVSAGCGKGGMCGGMMKQKGGMMHGDKAKKHGLANIMVYLNCPELELSDDQVSSLKKIKMDYKKLTITTKAELEIAHLDLKELTKISDPDFTGAKKKVNEILERKKKLKLSGIEAMEKGYLVLTDAQKKMIKGFKCGSKGCKKGGMKGKKKRK